MTFVNEIILYFLLDSPQTFQHSPSSCVFHRIAKVGDLEIHVRWLYSMRNLHIFIYYFNVSF